MQEGGDAPDARLALAFRLATGRASRRRELQYSADKLDEMLAAYRADEPGGAELDRSGRFADGSAIRAGRAGGLDRGGKYDSEYGRSDHERLKQMDCCNYARITSRRELLARTGYGLGAAALHTLLEASAVRRAAPRFPTSRLVPNG